MTRERTVFLRRRQVGDKTREGFFLFSIICSLSKVARKRRRDVNVHDIFRWLVPAHKTLTRLRKVVGLIPHTVTNHLKIIRVEKKKKKKERKEGKQNIKIYLRRRKPCKDSLVKRVAS